MPQVLVSTILSDSPMLISVYGPNAGPYGTYMTRIAKQSSGSLTMTDPATPIEFAFFYMPGPAAAASSEISMSSFGAALDSLFPRAFAS